MNYVPLWIKSDYSLLSSLIKIDDLINYLSLLNVKEVALCDDNLFGAFEFYSKCKNNGIKPIVGLEVTLDYEILLYAKNYHGYQNLCQIDSIKNRNMLTFDIMKSYLEDVIVVIPYDKKEDIDKFNSLDVFINVNNDNDLDIKNKVYMKKTLSLNKDDTLYLDYLYKIGQKEYDGSYDVYLENNINNELAKTTISFSKLCNLEIPKNTKLLPVYNKDENFDEKGYLSTLALKGLEKRLSGNITKNYIDRLKYELDVITKMGFCSYFLIVWDYVKYAKKNNILVGPGRGSAASSLVSYCLGITDIDPIKYDLLFERFLNPKRITMPDIDIDFDSEKRSDVINYVIDKYGKEKVCGIITFSNLLAKQVIRDTARLFDYPIYKIDEFLSYFDDKKDLNYQLKNEVVKNKINNDSTLKKIYDISLHLEGLKRHLSSHAAGIIISSDEIQKYAPTTINDDMLVCGYTMNYIEDLGFLKMDFLALKNLTVVSKVLEKIGNLKLKDIPLNDSKTFEVFKNGLLDGVFQFESSGMKKFIVDLKPNNINDLIAALALFRPGPIDNIPLFVRRKNGYEKVSYIDDSLKEILKETYGIIVYQEQIMQIASKMASFSYSKADELRRAMSKKKLDVLKLYEKDFIEGSVNNSYDKDTSKKVYNLILKFANYGFNKAHSVSYAILGYKMAYLKANYSTYFMCEILNNSLGVINKTNILLDECKKLNITLIKPNVNLSKDKYDIYEDKIIYPLSIIKNIGTLTSRKIIDERLEHGCYKSYIDFIKRNYKLGKDNLNRLILSGTLDEFNITKKTMIENLEDVICYSELCSDLDEHLVLKPEIKNYDEYDEAYLSKCEKELFGFYISNHPTYKYINENTNSLQNINDFFDKNVFLYLYFDRKKETTTKKNEKMMFISASDMYSSIDLVLFPDIYNKFFNLNMQKVYKVYGKVEKRFSKIQIVVSDIKIIE